MLKLLPGLIIRMKFSYNVERHADMSSCPRARPVTFGILAHCDTDFCALPYNWI